MSLAVVLNVGEPDNLTSGVKEPSTTDLRWESRNGSPGQFTFDSSLVSVLLLRRHWISVFTVG